MECSQALWVCEEMMKTPNLEEVKRRICAIWENLKCPICLDLMCTPVSTKCDHQFCKFCMLKLLESSKKWDASCPVCKAKVTKRSLKESVSFQRLVDGLKDIVQAFEQDTCIGCQTDVSQKTILPSPQKADQCEQGTVTQSKTSDMGITSLPSSVEAKINFAKLMDLEDSYNQLSVKEALDQMPDVLAPAVNRDVDITPTITTSGKPDKPFTHECVVSRQLRSSKKTQPTVEISRQRPKAETVVNKRRLQTHTENGVNSDKVLDKRQRRSLEKVSEWLSKISPSENDKDDKHIDSGLHHAYEDSVSESTFSTAKEYLDEEQNGSPKRKKPRLRPEENVFGLVYRRDRRSTRAVINSTTLLSNKVKNLLSYGPDEQKVFTKSTRKRLSNKLTPADFVKKPNTEKKMQKVVKAQEVSGAEGISTETQLEVSKMNDIDDNTKELVLHESNSGVPEEGVLNSKDSPLSSVPFKSVKTPMSDHQHNCQEVSNNLAKEDGREGKEMESGWSNNRRTTLSKKQNHLTLKKLPKAPKPLEIVCVETADCISTSMAAPMVSEVELQIECYPSSVGPVTPDSRATRHSRSLNNVRGCPRNANLTNIRKNDTLKQDENGTRDFEAVNPRDDGEQDTEQLVKTFKTTKRRSFHLCCDSTFQTAVGDPNKITPGVQKTEVVNEKTGAEKDIGTSGIVDNVELNEKTQQDSLGLDDCSVSKKSKRQSSNSCNSNANSNKLDFKISGKKNHNKKETISTAAHCNPEVMESSDLISQRNDSGSTVTSHGSTKNEKMNCTPQRKNRESSGCVATAENGASDVLFSTTEDETLSMTEVKQPLGIAESRSPRDSTLAKAVVDQVSTQRQSGELTISPTKNLESSMTPDDLLPPNIPIPPSINGSGAEIALQGREYSLHSQKGFTLRKRKHPQRLKSSESEGSTEEIELPSLAELFGTKRAILQAVQDQELDGPSVQDQECGEEQITAGSDVCDVQKCNKWIPASQASVDLFGTPEEGENAPYEAGLSGDSAQFSSEIIGTQQKLAMQEELRQLEKMMALVTEALHQKEANPEEGDGTVDPNALPQPTMGPDMPSVTPGKTSSRCKSFPQPEVCACDTFMEQSSESLSVLTGPEAPGVLSTTTQTPGQRCNKRGRHSRKGSAVTSNAKSTVGQVGDQGADVSGMTKQSSWATKRAKRTHMVLVGSGLSASELSMVNKFARKTSSSVCPQVTPETTHVIVKTDEDLVCERTLKYFLGIAGRKWMVSFLWISESFKQGKVLEENIFEVRGDVATGRSHQGPMKARTAGDLKLMMRDFEICFQGSFTDMNKGQMEWMVELCGAKVVKEMSDFSAKHKRHLQLVVVQPGCEESSTDYRALQKRATVVSRGWLLDTVATYTLQNPDEYRV